MTYRIETRAAASGHLLEVQGLVDAAALEAIRAAVAAARPGPLRIVLKEGCQVEPAVLEELGRMERVELVAESPFLASGLKRL